MSILKDKRAMILEDEPLIALDLGDELKDAGVTVIGTFGNVPDAMPTAAHEALDFAVLDVNLGSHLSYPIAAVLQQRAIPFVFASGYGSAEIQPVWASVPVVYKPFETNALLSAIHMVLRDHVARDA